MASGSGRKQLLGVVVRRYIDFVSVLFLQQHPYFCSFCFFVSSIFRKIFNMCITEILL